MPGDPTHRHDEFHRGLVPTDQLGTGTADDTTFLRGDQTYAVPAAADDQTAAEVPFTPAGSIAATDVQAAIEEVAAEAIDDQTAAEVPFTPAGSIAATDVQAAVEEVATDAAADLSAHEGAADPHPGYQQESEKDAAGGYAGLDGGGLVPIAHLATGTPDGTQFVRDDGTLAVPPAADDQVASEVPFTPAGSIAATDVQAAIEEVAAEATDDQVAADVPFTPAGTIDATDVQAAIEEVSAEAAVVPPLAAVLVAGDDAGGYPSQIANLYRIAAPGEGFGLDLGFAYGGLGLVGQVPMSMTDIMQWGYPNEMFRYELDVDTALDVVYRARLVDCIAAPLTLTLDVLEDMVGWWAIVRNSADSGLVTLVPPIGTIDGAASVTLAPGEARLVMLDAMLADPPADYYHTLVLGPSVAEADATAAAIAALAAQLHNIEYLGDIPLGLPEL